MLIPDFAFSRNNLVFFIYRSTYLVNNFLFWYKHNKSANSREYAINKIKEPAVLQKLPYDKHILFRN